MTDPKSLYEGDFVAWARQQAAALRATACGATNEPIDWENVAEEIDSLARSEKRELGSQIRRVIEHLLKLEFSPSEQPRRGWIESVGDARNEIEALLDDSPSLKNEVASIIPVQMRRGLRKAISELEKYGELDPMKRARICAATYTEDQILDDWFPPDRIDPQQPSDDRS